LGVRLVIDRAGGEVGVQGASVFGQERGGGVELGWGRRQYLRRFA